MVLLKMAANSDKEKYINELRKKINDRAKNQRINTEATKIKHDEEYDAQIKKLDSNVKKTTNYIKRLKNITEQQKDQLLKDFGNLNLSKYVEEMASSIFESKLKMTDVPVALMICYEAHKRYPTFSSHLYTQLQKILSASSNIISQGDETVQQTNLSKFRVDLRLAGELIASNMFMREDTKSKGFNMIYSMFKHIIEVDKEKFLYLNIIISFCKHFSEEYIGLYDENAIQMTMDLNPKTSFPRFNTFSPTEITAFRSLIYEGYFKTHLINRLKRDFEEFFKLNGTNRYIFRNKGELHPERVEKYHEIENAFNKLLNAAKALCLALHDNSKKCFPTFKLIPYDSMDDDDSLPNDMKWLLDEIAEKSAATHASADSAQQDNKDGVDDESAASAGATPFSSLAWRDEDEDTQKFYCDLPDLKTLIPVVGGGLGTTGAKAPLLHQTTLPEDKSAAASVDSNFIKGTEKKSKPHYDETTSTKCGAATASQKGKQQQRKRADEMSETTTTIMTTAGGVSSSCSKNPPHHTAVVIVSKSAEFDKFFDDNKKDDEEENGGHTGNHLLLDHDDNHNQVDKDDIQNHVAEEGITTVTAVISSAADASSIPPSSATTTTTTTTTVPPTNYYIDDDAEDTLSSLSTLGLNSDLDELDFDDGGGGLSSGGGAESTKKYLKNKTTQANEKIKKKRHNNSNNKSHRAGPGNNMTTASSSALGSAASNSSGPNNSINVFMKLKMDAFLEALPTRINRDLIDEAAINFLTHLNNKINRKRLIGHLLSVPRNRTDLLPFYSRFVALVTQCIPEFGKKDLSKKLYSSFRCQLRKKDQINLEVKLKIVRFLSELTKFSIFPPMDMCYCLFLLINDFKYHSIEMACAILENCGRFLVKTPETKRRAKFLLENLKRKKNATLLDERFSTLIENAYYTCLPDDDPLATALGAKQLSERAYELTLTPWQRYMRYLLYDAFNRKTFTLDKLVKVLRKFHWDNNHHFSLDNNNKNNDSSTATADLDTKNQLDDNLDVTVLVTPEEDDYNNNNSSNSVTPTTQTAAAQQQLYSSNNNNFNTAVSVDPENGVDSKDLDSSEDHSSPTLIIIRNLSDTEEFFVRLILNLSKFRFDDLPDLANVVSSLSVYRGDTIGIAVVDDLLELIRDSLTMLKFETKYSYHYQNEGVINMKRFKVEVNSQQSVLSAVKLIGEFYNYRLLDTPILFRFLFGLISFTSTLIMDDTDTEEGVNHDNNNYNPYNNFEPPNYLFSIRLVLVLLETCASYFDRGSFKKKLDIFLTYFQRYYLEKYEWIGWKIENPQEGESDTIFPIDIQNYYREVLDQLRPKGKLYTSLKEVKDAIRLIEEDYLMQLQKSLSPHPSDAAGPLYHHDDKGGNNFNDIESRENNPNKIDDQLSPNFQGGSTASTEPGNVADITTPLVTTITTTAITPNASGDSFNFYEDAKYDFVLPSGDEDEITPNATESIKSGETGGVTDREQKSTSYNTLSPKIKKCEEDEEFVKSFDTLLSESLLQRAHETVKLQNLDINLPPNIRSKASKLSSKLIKSITNEDEGGGVSTDDSQNQLGTGTNTARVMDFVLVCKKGNKPQYKDIKIPFDTKLAHRLKSLEEAERKEKEQMKKLTLNINRLQEEEEQKNQILELQQKSTFPIYAKETSQHQGNYHPGPGGGPYQRYYHKSANKLQSNQGNNQQIYHGGKL